jgi:Lysyl oxidase
VAITGRYVRLFDVPPEGAAATVTLVVRERRGGVLERAGRLATDDDGSSTPVPIVRAPARAGLPDLQPLPSWDITTRHMRRGDFLSFAANVWVGGNGPLVVEGFRRQGEEVMDAYQYFWEDGQPVGRARVGSMEYDPRRGHEHWHFMQFAAYQLLAADRATVVKSSKEAFCLVPTDAIDLTLPAAELQPGNVGLWTSCGGRSDLWIREVLPVGWGDTYYQYVPGQSFEITDVPNGTYFVKIVANPGRQLEELSYGNNVRLRKVILRGRPGHRRVEVPPWHGIDTEGWVERYGLGPSVG